MTRKERKERITNLLLSEETTKIVHITHQDMDGNACVIVLDCIVKMIDMLDIPGNVNLVELHQINPGQLTECMQSVMNNPVGYPDLIIISDLNFKKEHLELYKPFEDRVALLVADHHITDLSEEEIEEYGSVVCIDNREIIPTFDPEQILTSITTQTTSGAMMLYDSLWKHLLSHETHKISIDMGLLGYQMGMYCDRISRFCSIVATYDNYDHANRRVLDSLNDMTERIKTEGLDIGLELYPLWRVEMTYKLRNIYNAISKETFWRFMEAAILFPERVKLTSKACYPQDIVSEIYGDVGHLKKACDEERVAEDSAVSNALKGAVILRKTLELVDNSSGSPVKVEFGPYTFLIMEAGFKYKAVAANTAMVSDEYKDVDICCVIDWDRFTATFYTTPDSEINVQPIAKLLGGGGHPHASGFPISKSAHDWLTIARFNAMINLNPASAKDIPIMK